MSVPSWAKLVRARMRDVGLMSKDVAEALGVDKSTFSLYLSGQRRLKVTQLVNLAKFLGMNPAELVVDDQAYIIYDDEERALLDSFRNLDESKKAAILAILSLPKPE